jgi:hypothetical protein
MIVLLCFIDIIQNMIPSLHVDLSFKVVRSLDYSNANFEEFSFISDWLKYIS